jgi:ubiquinone/menaquinone biosynthesis C-methylase UbiE
MKLDNPVLVRWEYASEERLANRNAVLRSLSQGASPEDAAFEAIAERKPQRILDVGCGLGEIGERCQRELGAHVSAIDISPRMVELAKGRGLDAQVADAESLPFNDNSFDCVFAGWVLYHVPDLGRAVAECARVLTRDGVLVASSVCNDNIEEVWRLIGVTDEREPLKFTRDNGAAALARSFGAVEQRDFEGEIVFPDTESLQTFVASTIDRAHLAPQVPEISEPFHARTRHVVFVATEPK